MPTPTKDREPTSPYGVICEEHGKQGLTKDEYNAQMMRPDSLWRCPIRNCPYPVNWDDDRYEASFPQDDDNDPYQYGSEYMSPDDPELS